MAKEANIRSYIFCAILNLILGGGGQPKKKLEKKTF